jgi:hypothetical protein
MTKKLLGLFASVALLGSGVALADDWKKQDDKQAGSVQQPGSAAGGSGDVGKQGDTKSMDKPMDKGATGQKQQEAMGAMQLTGTVVKSSSNLLHLRTDNGIVPLKVTRETKFDDGSVKRAKDLKEGQQVRASFNISGTENVVTNISLSTDSGSDTGGSGLDQPMNPDTGINQPLDKPMDPPMDDGTGGAGWDTQGQDDLGGDMGGSGTLGDDSATDPMGGDVSKGDKDY